MQQAPAEDGLPPSVRLLKWLVIFLTATMIVGLITVVAVIVIRLPQQLQSAPAIPDSLMLPDGARPAAVTLGRGWVAVVTTDDRILIFDAESGRLRQEVDVLPATD